MRETDTPIAVLEETPPATVHSSRPPTPRIASRRRIAYAAGVLGLVVLSEARIMLPVFRDTLQRHLGIGDEQFGLLFSLPLLLGMLTVIPGGALTDRWGPRRVMRLFPRSPRRIMALNFAVAGGEGLLYPSLAEGLLALVGTGVLSFTTVMRAPFLIAALALAPACLFFRGRAGFARTDAPVRGWRWSDLALSRAGFCS